MKRILATVGIACLALIGATAPANAYPEENTNTCRTSNEATPSSSSHCTGDNRGGGWKDKDKDWKDDDRSDGGWKDHDWKDHKKPPVEKPPVVTPPVVTPPVVTPPVVTPPVVTPPVVTPPVVTPPVVTPPVVTPPVVTPPAVVAVPAGAAAAPVVNRGFNAQTAAGSPTDSGMPAWFGGLAALLGAAGLVALRQRGRMQDFQASK